MPTVATFDKALLLSALLGLLVVLIPARYELLYSSVTTGLGWFRTLATKVFKDDVEDEGGLTLWQHAVGVVMVLMFFRTLANIVSKDERCLSLWQHAVLGVVRSVALFESYRGSVEFLKDTIGIEEIYCDVGAFSVAVFFAAACSFPFEYVMTEINKMQPDAEGKYPYTGYLDCAVKTFQAGGPFKFFTGFSLICAKIFRFHLSFFRLFIFVILSSNGGGKSRV